VHCGERSGWTGYSGHSEKCEYKKLGVFRFLAKAFLTFEVGHNMITLTHDMILGHFREVEAFDESLRICTGLRHGDEVIERP
jgi:hypothetical protein